MYKWLLVILIISFTVSCKDRGRTASIQEVYKNRNIPSYPNSVTIEGKEREIILDFIRVQSKLAKELKAYWLEYTESGTSCTFVIGLNNSGEINVPKAVKCDNTEAFNKMMNEISIKTLSEEELRSLPSTIKMSVHN